jgi:hypothetical protein
MPAQIEVPNLDCLDDHGLSSQAERFAAIAAATHEEWAFALLTYARRALAARQYRLAGRVNDAVRLERYNERVYQSLPASCRW